MLQYLHFRPGIGERKILKFKYVFSFLHRELPLWHGRRIIHKFHILICIIGLFHHFLITDYHIFQGAGKGTRRIDHPDADCNGHFSQNGQRTQIKVNGYIMHNLGAFPEKLIGQLLIRNLNILPVPLVGEVLPFLHHHILGLIQPDVLTVAEIHQTPSQVPKDPVDFCQISIALLFNPVQPVIHQCCNGNNHRGYHQYHGRIDHQQYNHTQ